MINKPQRQNIFQRSIDKKQTTTVNGNVDSVCRNCNFVVGIGTELSNHENKKGGNIIKFYRMTAVLRCFIAHIGKQL